MKAVELGAGPKDCEQHVVTLPPLHVVTLHCLP